MLATGLVTVAASGLAAGSADAASTTIFACYSNTTDALSYLKPPATTCPTGTTLISWNQTGPQGAQGAKGFNWRGNWSSTTAYAVGDVVGYQGASWIAKVANTNSPPAISNTNWFTVAARGAVGAPGAQGKAGAQGAPGAQGVQGAQGKAGTNGAQGAAGAQGPQGFTGSPGPAGAVSGIAHYNFTQSVTLSPSYKVVDTVVTPVASTVYAVTGTARVAASSGSAFPGARVYCELVAQSGGGGVTASTEIGETYLRAKSDLQTIPTTGVLHISPDGVIAELCAASQATVKVTDTGISATRLTTGSTAAAARNKFIKPLKPQRPPFEKRKR